MNAIKHLISFISVKSKIRKEEISPETQIFDSGIVSSLTMLEMISFMEGKYDIFIFPEELTEVNFKDIQTIAEFIDRKMEKEMALTA